MNKKISQSEINKRIKQVTMEADFRFKCIELATPFSKNIDEVIKNLNLQPNSMPDLDNISLMSGDSDRNSTKGITLNL